MLKKKDADADDLLGLSSAKRGGKKPKKGAEKAADKPVSPLLELMPTLRLLLHGVSCRGACYRAFESVRLGLPLCMARGRIRLHIFGSSVRNQIFTRRCQQ